LIQRNTQTDTQRETGKQRQTYRHDTQTGRHLDRGIQSGPKTDRRDR